MSARERAPGGCRPTAVFAGLSLVGLVVAGVLTTWGGASLDPAAQTALGIVGAVLALLGAAAGTALLQRWGREEVGFVPDRGVRLWLAAVLGGGSVGIVGSLLAERWGEPLARALSWPESADALDRFGEALLGSTGALRLALILLAILVGPLAEELAFRGLLWRALPPRPVLRVLVTTLAFALLHLDPVQSLGVLPLGLLLGWLRLRSRGLGPVALAHVVNNTVALGLMTTLPDQDASAVIVGVALALTGVGVGLAASARQVE